MTNITQDQLSAAEEAFGTHVVEPYIGMRMKTGKKCRLFNKTHALIYDLYKEDKSVVDDEIELLSKVWAKKNFNQLYEQHGLLYALSKLTHPETISRRRRELHQAGLIEYSPKAMKSRETAFKNERDKASPIPPQLKKAIVHGKLVQVTPTEKYIDPRFTKQPIPPQAINFARDTFMEQEASRRTKEILIDKAYEQTRLV